MTGTSARLLALLSLLQARPDWTGPELAERLEVTVRTVRNDVARLRDLGYPVDSTRGTAGHYRLGHGASLPPLLLDDDEAVSVAVGLQAASGIVGVTESSRSALAKLEQVLPSRLRRRVESVARSIDRGPENTRSNAADPEVDPSVVADVAEAIRRAEWLRFDHRDSTHLVEPYRLVSWQRRWYLVARDTSTHGWGSFRLDWVRLRPPTGRRFSPDPLPEHDYVDFVVREVASSGWSVHARITVSAPAASVIDRINPAVGVVEPLDERTCVLVTGADSVETIAAYIGMLGLDFHVPGPPELVHALQTMSRRYAAATAPTAAWS